MYFYKIQSKIIKKKLVTRQKTFSYFIVTGNKKFFHNDNETNKSLCSLIRKWYPILSNKNRSYYINIYTYTSACRTKYNKETPVSCVWGKQTAPLLKDNQYTGGLPEDKDSAGTDVDLQADCANTLSAADEPLIDILLANNVPLVCVRQ